VSSVYLDVCLEKEKSFQYKVKEDHNSMIYVHSGIVMIDGEDIKRGNLVEFAAGTTIDIKGSEDGTGFLLLSGKPNNEPYYRGGPFVMNTKEEIEEAFNYYQNGDLF
jgi:quercetin 2,3-dioxygenase